MPDFHCMSHVLFYFGFITGSSYHSGTFLLFYLDLFSRRRVWNIWLEGISIINIVFLFFVSRFCKGKCISFCWNKYKQVISKSCRLKISILCPTELLARAHRVKVTALCHHQGTFVAFIDRAWKKDYKFLEWGKSGFASISV